MPLLDKLLQTRRSPFRDGRTRIRTDRDRERVRVELRRGLDRLEKLTAEPGIEVLELQPLLQVVAPGGYAAFRQAREKAWRDQGGCWTTRQWPHDLVDGHVGVLLLPLLAGRVGVAVGKHPRAVVSPLFTCGEATSVNGHHDACLTVLTNWVLQPGPGLTARLAPPIIEVVQLQRVVQREVEGFGQAWPLPVADGL